MGVYAGERLGLKAAIVARIRDAAELVLKPRRFVAHQGIDARRRLHRVLRGLKWRELRDRRRHLASLPPVLKPIPETVGFRFVDDIEPAVIAAALSHGQKLLAGLDLDALRRRSKSQHLVAEPLTFESADDPLLALALHPALVKMIGDYIGSLPVLNSCKLSYSPNTEVLEATSQFYHLDGQDLKTLQVYLFLNDIGPANGPFVAYPAEASERFARSMNYRKVGHTLRVADSFIEQHLSGLEPQVFTGPQGSLMVCDSDRCFHYGSRGSRPRFLVAFQYVSAAGFEVPFRKNRLHILPKTGRLEEWQVKVLGG